MNAKKSIGNVTVIVQLLLFLQAAEVFGQQSHSVIDSFTVYTDIHVTIDKPAKFVRNRETIITFFALPNGNTTAQTMGKKMNAGDDWHYDIQHIRAQTAFIRKQLHTKNFVVIYLENSLKSWPAWKQQHINFKEVYPVLIDSLTDLIEGEKKSVYLNGHSGGGSFIFGYLAAIEKIPLHIKRISFLDSEYGYDSTYYPKLKSWLKKVKGATLTVFAYNDSVALYNGKPVVSATGGTWYRSHLLLMHLQKDFVISKTISDSLTLYQSANKQLRFFFKENYNRGIYHTQQVELNGFIHSILCSTKYESKGYFYYSKRAYDELIE